MEEISHSFSFLTLRSPASASHWPNPRGSQPSKEMGVMEAVEGRCSPGSRERKMIWGGIGIGEGPREQLTWHLWASVP